MGKHVFLAVMLIVMGNSLFAHEKGDVFINPEAGVGLEIPNIHLKNEPSEGDYVSLGLDWGARITAGYYFFNWLAAGAGLGFGGFHDTNNYNSRDQEAALTATYMYDAMYLIIPAGFRVNRGRFAAGAGIAGYIPVFFNFSGESRQPGEGLTVKTDMEDDNFSIHPFMGGYIDVGYDWAGLEGSSRGFGVYVRAEFPFDETIAKSDAGFRTFQHAGISLIVSYCFRVVRFPKN